MDQCTDILDLLSLDPHLRPPRDCQQIRSDKDDLEVFIRARIDHITATLRTLKRDTRDLNTMSCQFLVGPRRSFREERFMKLVQKSQGHNQWICCGPRKGEPLRSTSENIASVASSVVASPDCIVANGAMVHGAENSPMQVNPESEHQEDHEQSAAISQSAHLNELRVRYQGFRTEMIERVTQEIELLKTTLVNRVKINDISEPTRRTRQNQASSLGDKGSVSLDDLLSKSLGHFTAKLITTLDSEFIRRFPELSDHSQYQHPAANDRAELEIQANTSDAQAQSSLSLTKSRPATNPDEGSQLQEIEVITSEPTGDADSSLSSVNDVASHIPETTSNLNQPGQADSDSSSTSPSSSQEFQPESGRDIPGRTRKRNANGKVSIRHNKRRNCAVLRGAAAEVMSEKSIRHFMTLVTTSRSVHLPLTTADFDVRGGWNQRAASYWQLARALGNSSNLYGLLSLVAQIEVADGLDRAAKPLGYTRVPSSMIEDVLRTLGTDVSRASRSKFQHFLRKPRKLIKVFGIFIGLLCFVPLEEEEPCSVTVKSLLEMSEKPHELAEFRCILEASEFAVMLSEVGRKFQQCMLSRKAFPDMLFEKIDDRVLCGLAFEDLTRLMSVWYVNENLVESPTWAKPRGWHGSWPVDPTSLLQGANCELCGESGCSCIQTCFGQVPKVVNCGTNGLGLEAAATHEGKLVYKAGQKIGEFVGRLVAPGSFHDSFAIDLVRSDMRGQPTVAQVYTRNQSSLFRFVNHRCKTPSAKLEGVAISQRYRLVLSALRDVYVGEAITIDFGGSSRKGASCSCEDCT